MNEPTPETNAKSFHFWKWLKKNIWKIIAGLSTLIIMPIVAGYITNIFTWITTKDAYSVTLKLDGWISIKSKEHSEFKKLKLLWNDKEIESVTKVSWLIINTGNKGIKDFESEPTIIYPKSLNVTDIIISEKSPNLNITDVPIIKGQRVSVKDLGIFNVDEFIKIDFYITDLKETILNDKHFETWEFLAKSLDLKININISETINSKKDDRNNISTWLVAILLLILIGHTFELIGKQRGE